MAISDYFKNNFEFYGNTYGSDYYKTQETISSLLKKDGFTLLNVDNKYHEMLLEKKRIQVIVTLSEVGMYETGVSIKVNTSYLFPMARGLKWGKKFYEMLDKTLVLKEKGNRDAK